MALVHRQWAFRADDDRGRVTLVSKEVAREEVGILNAL